MKIKLSKGELKKQRDALKQYERFLPTLQLKKQQLQMEILHHVMSLEQKEHIEATKRKSLEAWIGLVTDIGETIKPWLIPQEIVVSSRNVAGIDIPVFERVEFKQADYDLFLMPLWLDNGLDLLRAQISLIKELETIKKAVAILRHELRITTQRVNLFEKVKIPEAQEAIRIIKIYIGDQMSNAVGRSKIAKRKIEQAELVGSAL